MKQVTGLTAVIDDKKQRADMIEFLRGLDIDSSKMAADKKIAKK